MATSLKTDVHSLAGNACRQI